MCFVYCTVSTLVCNQVCQKIHVLMHVLVMVLIYWVVDNGTHVLILKAYTSKYNLEFINSYCLCASGMEVANIKV